MMSSGSSMVTSALLSSGKRQAALLGMSANPPSGLSGHQGIVRYLTQCQHFQDVFILPVFSHMFVEKHHHMQSFEDRMMMCQLAFEQESTEQCKVEVTTFEQTAKEHYLHISGPNYRVGTVDVLEYLLQQDQYKDMEFTFVLGSDTFRDLANGKWKQADRIVELSKILVMERKGVDAGPIDEKAQAFLSRHVGRISFHAAPWLEDISSSWLREHKPWNNPDLDVVEKEKLIHPKVVDYILTHHLYD